MTPATFLKLCWVELKLLLREPMALIFVIAYPLVVMFVVTGVFNNSSGPYFLNVPGSEYYVVSNLAVAVAAVGLVALPLRIAGYVEGGVMRRFRASSVPVIAVILAQALVCVVVALGATALLLAVARPVYFYPLPQFLPGVVLGFALGLVALLCLGLLVVALFPSTRAAQGAGLILFFPMYLICGAGPPLGVLPAPMRHVADFDPMKYAVQALQDPWFGRGVPGSTLIILTAIALVSASAAVLLIRQR